MRIEIYERYHGGEPTSYLSKIYDVRISALDYLVRLIDLHGYDILRNREKTYYSIDFKQELINEVLIDKKSINSTALKYGLPSNGILFNWLRSYKENNYVIVEKRKGRQPTMTRKKNDKKYEELSDKEKIKFLEKKNEYLEAEVEYRKKLRAVVLAREKQEQKKK